MIHSARPIVTPASSEHCFLLFCFSRFEKRGRTYVRTTEVRATRAKPMIPTGRDFGLGKWINIGKSYLEMYLFRHCKYGRVPIKIQNKFPLIHLYNIIRQVHILLGKISINLDSKVDVVKVLIDKIMHIRDMKICLIQLLSCARIIKLVDKYFIDLKLTCDFVLAKDHLLRCSAAHGDVH